MNVSTVFADTTTTWNFNTSPWTSNTTVSTTYTDNGLTVVHNGSKTYSNVNTFKFDKNSNDDPTNNYYCSLTLAAGDIVSVTTYMDDGNNASTASLRLTNSTTKAQSIGQTASATAGKTLAGEVKFSAVEEAGTYYIFTTSDSTKSSVFYASITVTSSDESGGTTTTPDISISTDNAAIEAGNSTTISATITGADVDEVKWTSSNESAATVAADESDVTTATVTGLAAGTTVITASITVDNTTYTSNELTITVTESSSSGGDTGDTGDTGDSTVNAYLYFISTETAADELSTATITKEYYSSGKTSACGVFSFTDGSYKNSGTVSGITISNVGTYSLANRLQTASGDEGHTITITVPNNVDSATFYAVVSSTNDSGSSREYKFTSSDTSESFDSVSNTVAAASGALISFSNLTAGNTYTLTCDSNYCYYLLGLVTTTEEEETTTPTYVYFGITDEQQSGSSSYSIYEDDTEIATGYTVYEGVDTDGDGSSDKAISEYTDLITADEATAATCKYIVAYILGPNLSADSLSIEFTPNSTEEEETEGTNNIMTTANEAAGEETGDELIETEASEGEAVIADSAVLETLGSVATDAEEEISDTTDNEQLTDDEASDEDSEDSDGSDDDGSSDGGSDDGDS
ncbi:MAG: Ig-like domain-containing protein [Clostridiales bacterium]|nr:Ig-like domain-containing protein [Clostridiales bacterium]